MSKLSQLFLLFVLSFFVNPRGVHGACLVFLIGEDEYLTSETLPNFAKQELEPQGHRVRVVNADSTDKNRFPGLVEALRGADLLLVSVRRRTLEMSALQAVKEYVASGRPVFGIRTASHAFALLPKAVLSDPRLGIWPEFDREVLGGNYAGHHKGDDKTMVAVVPGREGHEILKGVSVGDLVGNGTLYRNTPLAADAAPLLMGTIPGQPAEPVAWTRLHGGPKARVFYTSMGHPHDFRNAEFVRMLRNAVGWALGSPKEGL